MTETPSPDEIRDAVHNRQAWGIRALQQIIAIDSISPNEQTCRHALAEILRGEGLPVELLPLDNSRLRAADGFIDFGLPLDNRPNLTTFIGKDDGGRSLILNSHIDIVNWAETAHHWDTHPLSGLVQDGKLCGRGSMDVRCFMNRYHMPAVIFGPGKLALAHAVIRERYAAGESLSQLARAFGISFQWVQQIVKR